MRAICDFYETFVIERNGILYHCKERTGGDGISYTRSKPDKNKINIVSKESNKIVFKANLKGVVSKSFDDLWGDKYLDCTFIIENNNWVLLKYPWGEE